MDLPPPPLPPPAAADLLFSLPTRLDLRDAVRTSAISCAWRRRWETLPGLALSFPNGTPPSAIDRVLRRYAGPSVSRFACHVDEASASHVDDWLMALSRRSVESIAIVSECRRISTLTIHSYIFSCDRLVSLNLVRCFIPALLQPGGGFASFPVLKELYLTCVDFGESHLLRASPMLRVLLLENVYLDADMDCVIEAPNLHNLTLISCTDDWRFGELPHLQCACINVPHYLWGGTADFVECLTGVSQARELILYLPTLCDFKMDAIPFTISNLKSMELSTDFADMHRILLMFCLLRSSPNLEKLKIEASMARNGGKSEVPKCTVD